MGWKHSIHDGSEEEVLVQNLMSCRVYHTLGAVHRQEK